MLPVAFTSHMTAMTTYEKTKMNVNYEFWQFSYVLRNGPFSYSTSTCRLFTAAISSKALIEWRVPVSGQRNQLLSAMVTKLSEVVQTFCFYTDGSRQTLRRMAAECGSKTLIAQRISKYITCQLSSAYDQPWRTKYVLTLIYYTNFERMLLCFYRRVLFIHDYLRLGPTYNVSIRKTWLYSEPRYDQTHFVSEDMKLAVPLDSTARPTYITTVIRNEQSANLRKMEECKCMALKRKMDGSSV